jgi:Spy/CpxP family protein refolding chaperone
MSDTPAISKRSKWWQVLLIASLALNLLIGGAVATRWATHGGPDRMMGASYIQLIPRRFFADMPRERRKVLLDIMRKYRDDFRGDREASEQAAVKLADAIVAEPYDVEKVKLVVGDFSSQNGKLAARGGDAALEILSVLTPEERQSLAAAIRDRASKKKK